MLWWLLVPGFLAIFFGILFLVLKALKAKTRRKKAQQNRSVAVSSEAAAETVQPATQPSARDNRRDWRWGWLVIELVGLAIVAVVAYLFFGDNLLSSPAVESGKEWLGKNWDWVVSNQTMVPFVLLTFVMAVTIFITRGRWRVAAIFTALLGWGVILLSSPGIPIPGMMAWLNFSRTPSASATPLKYQSVYLDGVARVVNPTLKQARVDVQSEGCILLYNQAHRFVGKSCPGANEVVNGLIYSASSEDGRTLLVNLTICPLGSPGTNSGSCN